MSTAVIAGIVGGAYAVVLVFGYALMKTAGDADDAIEDMFRRANEEAHID